MTACHARPSASAPGQAVSCKRRGPSETLWRGASRAADAADDGTRGEAPQELWRPRRSSSGEGTRVRHLGALPFSLRMSSTIANCSAGCQGPPPGGLFLWENLAMRPGSSALCPFLVRLPLPTCLAARPGRGRHTRGGPPRAAVTESGRCPMPPGLEPSGGRACVSS
jgi:hypothetical protein